MVTCKDCIHCRACHEMYLLAVSQEDDFFERHDAETCEDFESEADFAKVKHGEWKKSQFSGRSGFYSLRDVICSECGVYSTFLQYEIRPDYYCPNCGAKMDGRS